MSKLIINDLFTVGGCSNWEACTPGFEAGIAGGNNLASSVGLAAGGSFASMHFAKEGNIAIMEAILIEVVIANIPTIMRSVRIGDSVGWSFGVVHTQVLP